MIRTAPIDPCYRIIRPSSGSPFANRIPLPPLGVGSRVGRFSTNQALQTPANQRNYSHPVEANTKRLATLILACNPLAEPPDPRRVLTLESTDSMAAATLRCSPSRPPRQASSFELLGGELSSYHLAGDSLAPAAFDNVLDELTVKYCQNRSPRREGEDRSFKLESTAVQEIPSPTLNINPRGSRHRRPQIQQETFEPLEVVREEPSWFSNENSTLLSAHHGAEKQHFSPPRQGTLTPISSLPHPYIFN